MPSSKIVGVRWERKKTYLNHAILVIFLFTMTKYLIRSNLWEGRFMLVAQPRWIKKQRKKCRRQASFLFVYLFTLRTQPMGWYFLIQGRFLLSLLRKHSHRYMKRCSLLISEVFLNPSNMTTKVGYNKLLYSTSKHITLKCHFLILSHEVSWSFHNTKWIQFISKSFQRLNSLKSLEFHLRLRQPLICKFLQH